MELFVKNQTFKDTLVQEIGPFGARNWPMVHYKN
jgi:hypothetical protein